jgi:transposase
VSLPDGVSNCLLGPRAIALVATLTGAYRLSQRLVQELLHDVCGMKLSLGAVSKTEDVVSAALLSITEEAKAYVQQAPVVHCDEAGHKERGEKR